MTFYIVQTILLLTVAYFVGAWFGCSLRSWLSRRGNTGTGLTDESAGVPASSAPAAGVFEDAVSHEEEEAQTIASTATDYVDVAVKVPEREQARDQPVPVQAITEADQNGEAKSDESAAIKDEELEPVQTAVGEVRGQTDDFRLIKGIDDALDARLKAMGIANYTEVACWKAVDVRRVSEVLGFSGQIERENWIEQAKILGDGGMTLFASSVARSEDPCGFGDGSLGDDLDDGWDEIDGDAGDAPRQEGRKSFEAHSGEQQAGDDLDAGQSRLSLFSSLDSRNHFKIREDEREVAGRCLREGKAVRQKPGKRRLIRSASVTVQLQAKYFVFRAQSCPDRPVLDKCVRKGTCLSVKKDDLKKIKNIDVLMERKLNAIGIKRFADIAGMTDNSLKKMSQKFNFSKRFKRESWVSQARLLANGAGV